MISPIGGYLPSSASLASDLRDAARHLVTHPMVLAENNTEMFQMIRRHQKKLDRWFTQRFGYRLQVTVDTARLFKSTVIASRRPLRTANNQKRAFTTREYTMLALALAAVAAGRSVTSLRDLIREIRLAATEADVPFGDEASDRRTLVCALRWMIAHGIATEIHNSVDRYANDGEADAVLQIRADRIALLPIPALANAETVDQLLESPAQRVSSRPRMRALLLEEPVVYRSDMTQEQWSALRRRLGDESAMFNEMFGLHIEARSEGLVAIDPDNQMTDAHFPREHTSGHAALLLIEQLVERLAEQFTGTARSSFGNSSSFDNDTSLVNSTAFSDTNSFDRSEVVGVVAELAGKYRSYWSKSADNPERLTDSTLDLLQDHRLVEVVGNTVRLLPAAWRYNIEIGTSVQKSLLG